MTPEATWTPGYAFYSPPDAPDGGHLWGVFAVAPNGEAFIANVTTLRRHSDRSCLLRPGEHPKIRHESCINYAASKLVMLDRLRAIPNLGATTPFSEELVRRVVAGAIRSDEVPAKVKAFLGSTSQWESGPGGAVREVAALTYS